MIGPAWLAERIDRVVDLAARDALRSRLTFAALVNRILEEGGLQALVVGGTAVDTYVSGALGTSASYPTGWEESTDVDSILLQGLYGVSRERALELVLPLGFETNRTRATIEHPRVPFPIDLVGDGWPDDYSRDHEVEVYVPDIEELDLRSVHLAGPEDILFDYMESGWDTRSQRDWTRALAIAAVYGDDLDVGYLFGKAEWRMAGQFVAPLEQVLRGEPLA